MAMFSFRMTRLNQYHRGYCARGTILLFSHSHSFIAIVHMCYARAIVRTYLLIIFYVIFNISMLIAKL